MIVVMRIDARDEDIQRVCQKIQEGGGEAHVDRGIERTIIGVRCARHTFSPDSFRGLPGVAEVIRILKPYKLCSREFHPSDTRFRVRDREVGGKQILVAAGPCSVEDREQILSTAKAVKEAGAAWLRGGAFKPRSSPYAFQGLGEEGLALLAEARQLTGLPVITEVMQVNKIEAVAAHADILQIGARNMQNFDLLKEVARAGKPVFLKRGFAAKIEELLMSAEYLLDGGCEKVILCERGIRTFETATRNTLDIAAIPVLKKLTHLPVFVDPSHAAGFAEYVLSLSLAAIAAGADGLIVEVHPHPDSAKSDGPQSLTFAQFADLMKRCRYVAEAVGRSL